MWYSFHTELCAKNFPFIVSETLDACAYLSRDGVFAPTRRMAPTPHGFVLPHPRPASHDRKNFLTPSSPLRGPRSPVPPRKTYFLLICSQLLQLFLIKPVLLIKIYLKLQINLSHQIKLIFSKN